MSTQSTANVNPNSQAQKEGRDANGRFTAGNRGGPGNPFKRQVAGIRQALIKSISEEEIHRVGRKLLELSLEGNVPAAKLLFEYVIGKPLPAPEPDRLDVDEWEGFQETACMKVEAAALSNVGEPEFHLNFVRNARPIVTTLMQEQMAAVANETPEQRKKREDVDAAECERILNSPAPERFYEEHEDDEVAPSLNGENGKPAPSSNGGKRRPQPAKGGAAPSTNGRFHVE